MVNVGKYSIHSSIYGLSNGVKSFRRGAISPQRLPHLFSTIKELDNRLFHPIYNDPTGPPCTSALAK